MQSAVGGAGIGVQPERRPSSVFEMFRTGVQDAIDYGLVSPFEQEQLMEFVRLPSGQSVRRYDLENRLRRLERAAPKRDTEYWMGLADIAMVGMPTFGEKKHSYVGRESLVERLRAMDQGGLTASTAQGLIVPAVLQTFGVEEGNQRLAWAGLDQDLSTDEERLAQSGAAGDFGPGSMLSLGIETITDRGKTDQLIAAMGRKLRGDPNPSDDPNAWDRESIIERELAKPQPGDKIYRAVTNIGSFFVPGLAHLRVADEAWTSVDRLQQQGVVAGAKSLIGEAVTGINVFESGIDLEERIARGLMAAVAVAGVTYGTSAARGAHRNILGLREAGYSQASAVQATLARYPVLRKVYEGTIYADPSLKWVAKAGDSQTTIAWRNWLKRTPEQARKTEGVVKDQIEALSPAERVELKAEAEQIATTIADQSPGDVQPAKVQGSGFDAGSAAERLKASGVVIEVDTDLLELQRRNEQDAADTTPREKFITRVTNRFEFQAAIEDKFRLRPDESKAVTALADAWASTWAAETGRTPEEWFTEKIAGIGRDGERFQVSKEQAEADARRRVPGLTRQGPKVEFEYRDPETGEVSELSGQVVWATQGRPIIETPDGWRYHVEPEDVKAGLSDEVRGRMESVRDASLAQSGRAMVEFLDDGRALIRALEKPDVSSIIHELGHIYRREIYRDNRLADIDFLKVEKWAGVKGRVWTVEAEEKFARALETYVATGKAPTLGLREAFAKIKEWMKRLYRGVNESPLSEKLSPDARQLFDRLFGKEIEEGLARQEAEAQAAILAAEAQERAELEEIFAIDPDDPRLDPYGDDVDQALIDRILARLGREHETRSIEQIISDARESYQRAEMDSGAWDEGSDLDELIWSYLKPLVEGKKGPRLKPGERVYTPWHKRNGQWTPDKRNLTYTVDRDAFNPTLMNALINWVKTYYNDPGYVLVPSLSRETIHGQTVAPRDGRQPSEMMFREDDLDPEEIPYPIVRAYYDHIKAKRSGKSINETFLDVKLVNDSDGRKRARFKAEQYEFDYEVRPDTKPEQIEGARQAIEAVLSRRGVSQLAARIIEDVEKAGGASLIGKEVTSIEDIATIFQVVRDPRWETSRVIYVKDGVIVDVESFSVRMPASAVWYGQDDDVAGIGRRIRELGADSVYHLHNHPSGSSTPSTNDTRSWKQTFSEIPEFKAGIVIDNNEYSYMDRVSRRVVTERKAFPERKWDVAQTSEYGKLIGTPMRGVSDAWLLVGKAVPKAEVVVVGMTAGATPKTAYIASLKLNDLAGLLNRRGEGIARRYNRQQGAVASIMFIEADSFTTLTAGQRAALRRGIRDGHIFGVMLVDGDVLADAFSTTTYKRPEINKNRGIHLEEDFSGIDQLFQGAGEPRELPEGWEVRRRDADSAGKKPFEFYSPDGELRGRADSMDDAIARAVLEARKDQRQESRASMAATQGQDPKARKRPGMAPELFQEVVDDLAVVMASKADDFQGEKGTMRRWLQTNKKLSHAQASEVIRRVEEIDAARAIGEVYRDSGGSYGAIKQMLEREYPQIAKSRYNRAVRRALEMAGTPMATRPFYKKDPVTGRKEADHSTQFIVIGANDVMVPAAVTRDMNTWASRLENTAEAWTNEERFVAKVSQRSEEVHDWLIENRREAATAMTEEMVALQEEMAAVYGNLAGDKEARKLIFWTAEGFKTEMKRAKDGLEEVVRVPFFEDELKALRPNDWFRIRDIADWHQAKYADLLQRMNAQRSRYKMGLIPERPDYMTHIREEAEIWQKLLGLDPEARAMGGAFDYKRNSVANRFAKKRHGVMANFDSLAAFEAYTNVALREIHLMEPTVRRRTLSRVLQQNDVNSEWGQVIGYIENLANQLTGQKQSMDVGLDKVLGGTGGKRLDILLDWAAARIGRNKIVGNLRSAVMQTAAMPVALPIMGGSNMVRGAMARVATISGAVPDISQASPFLRRRYGLQQELSAEFWDKATHVAGTPMRVIEETVTRTLWQGFHLQASGAGKSIEDAVRYADTMTEKIVGGRSVAEMPPIFKTRWGRLGLQFQYEVGNFVQFLGQDIKYDYLNKRQRTPQEMAWMASKLMVSLYVANSVYEQVFGSRPLPDAIDMANDMAGIVVDDSKGAAEKLIAFFGRPVGEGLSAVPGGTTVAGVLPREIWGMKVQDVLGDTEAVTFAGTTPLTSSIGKMLSGDSPAEVASALTFEIGLPFGGAQLKKTAEGILAVAEGDHKDRFDVEGSDSIRAILFGPNATGAAIAHYSGKKDKKKDDSGPSRSRSRTRSRVRSRF